MVNRFIQFIIINIIWYYIYILFTITIITITIFMFLMSIDFLYFKLALSSFYKHHHNYYYDYYDDYNYFLCFYKYLSLHFSIYL
jgi:hypothetical protein